jgi:Na+-translocating ferredoxin:NAD+ oxidoreductase RnfE subunit
VNCIVLARVESFAAKKYFRTLYTRRLHDGYRFNAGIGFTRWHARSHRQRYPILRT